jgi:hypothetical protein
MIHFVFGSLLINGVISGIIFCFGRRLMRLPLPGLWVLGCVLLGIVLTLIVAEATLS